MTGQPSAGRRPRANRGTQGTLRGNWLFIDPRCKELVKDFERVCWRDDETGQATSELDKSDRVRTRVSDALGYYVAQTFLARGPAGERAERLW